MAWILWNRDNGEKYDELILEQEDFMNEIFVDTSGFDENYLEGWYLMGENLN